MLTTRRSHLPGEDTLVESWSALAALSPAAHLIYTPASVAAVFPRWAPLNNAILREPPSTAAASTAAADLAPFYRDAGVASWALWVPSPARDLDTAETVSVVAGMTRDTTTLVMTRDLVDGMPSHPGVVRTTVEIANLAGDMPVPADALPDRVGPAGAEGTDETEGWVLIDDEYAVAGAWTYRHGSDVGIYAVGTAPEWRRRGIGRALMLHLLADAYRRGARTASLQSTRMGQPLYASLGFTPVGRYEEWVPCTSC